MGALPDYRLRSVHGLLLPLARVQAFICSTHSIVTILFNTLARTLPWCWVQRNACHSLYISNMKYWPYRRQVYSFIQFILGLCNKYAG